MTFQSKDPGKPLRFVPPSTTPPFERKRLTLKQTDPSRLDEIGKHASKLFSVWFDTWNDNKARDIEDAYANLESLSPGGRSEYEVTTDVRPNRRFSGDGFLSASRYYSLCDPSTGFDGGTMLRELTAYHDPWTKGLVDIVDLADNHPEGNSESDILARDDASKGPGILISIPPFTATEYAWLRSAAMRWEATRIVLPATISEITLERVVDLRVPRVATWFTQNLTRLQWLTGNGSVAPAFPRKAPLDSFQELLPTLVVQIHGGGNGATRIAGQWLRSLGADALIYPSARSDTALTVIGGEVASFCGWCLVDYRGAHPARLQTFDLTTHWSRAVATEIDELPLSVYSDIVLQYDTEGQGSGSWRFQNVETGNHAIRSLAAALHLYAWANREVSTKQQQLLGAMLGGNDRAEVMQGRAAWFCRALLGDSKARQVLLDLSVHLSPDMAKIVDLTGTFGRMDKRIAASKDVAD
jgi:hypothetical protein